MEKEVNRERLLKKYYDGETTLDEEKWLTDHVLRDKETVEQFIFKELEYLKQKNNDHKIVTKNHQNIRMRILAICSLITAACFLLFIWNPLKNDEHLNITKARLSNEILLSNTPEGTIEDPKVALEQAQKALSFVSEKLNTGIENIDHLNKLNQLKK